MQESGEDANLQTPAEKIAVFKATRKWIKICQQVAARNARSRKALATAKDMGHEL